MFTTANSRFCPSSITLEVRGFGSFAVRQYKPYDGRNPRNGEAVHVASKRMPVFKVGKELKERVDDGGAPGDFEGPAKIEISGATAARPLRT